MSDGDWKAALDAFEEAAKLVPAAHWVGNFLDGAALAAHRLGRKDAAQKLEAAWTAAPSLARLLRWLVADGPSTKRADGALVRKRAAAVLASPPTRAASMLAFLHLLGGEPAVGASTRESSSQPPIACVTLPLERSRVIPQMSLIFEGHTWRSR